VLLTPVAVTRDNIKHTVVKDGFYKPSEICTGKYAAGCKSAGRRKSAQTRCVSRW
jgi:D-xylose transport system substrate-binding protein